ncbi:MAG: DUF2997 domain-containing protein [Deltaproteobacteria bacterium]|nr:DUF2997 domain-containing protein [Deltaproteobacteria bacterium]
MAVKRELDVVIAPDGTIQVTTRGFKGTDCEDEVKTFEKALGTVTARRRTAEFYEKKAASKTKVSSTAK